MSLAKFDHKVTEARPAIMDSEGFWVFHVWVDQQKVWAINDDISKGRAKLIESSEDSPIITFGNGFHWQVESISRCSVCSVQISYHETGDFGACHADQLPAGLDHDASH